MRGPDWLWLGLLYECRNPACTTGPHLIDRQGGVFVLLEACCWLLCVCVLLLNSSVQPWFHLIQFPSNPLSVRSCPLSFLHPDNFIFYFSPLFSLPSDDPAVNSAFHSCNSRSFPHPPFPFFSCPSALWCGDRWCVLDLVMSPSPLPHSRLYWPITPQHSLTPFFPLFFSHPPSSLSQSLLLIDKPLFYSFAKSHILASFSH